MQIHKFTLTALPFGSMQGQMMVYVQISAGATMQPAECVEWIERLYPAGRYPLFIDFARSVKDEQIAELVEILLQKHPQIAARGWWTIVRPWMSKIRCIQRLNIKDWVGIPFAEMHMVYDDPKLVIDPVLVTPQAQIFIEPGAPATFQDLINFLHASGNQWKILMPPKFELTKDLQKEPADVAE